MVDHHGFNDVQTFLSSYVGGHVRHSRYWDYLGGQGDLVSRLLMGINGITIWVIGVIKLLTKSP